MMKTLSPEDVQRIWKIVVDGLKKYPATFAAEMDRKREKEIETGEENSRLSRSRMRK